MTAADAPADDLALIVAAAHEAGELAAELRDRGLSVSYKAGDSPVTNADFAADRLLLDRLGGARPTYGWLSEETADDPRRLAKKRLFLVDPIDGTRAFIKGKPWWAVCIAVIEGDRPIAGVVFAPQVGETYAATLGGGATLNGQPIRASEVDTVEGCGMVGDPQMFAHPGWPVPWPRMRIEPRNSTAYRMCLVAAGAFDATVAPVAKHDWDLAAADLIASEAGCFVGDHAGEIFRYNQRRPMQRSLICTAPGLAPLILERVRPIAVPS
ncbi:3'(2'),5'-bisphosphate nucleotidase CysQ [Phenylobacterium sp.]|uniref:3'(2'),5'-bisphosphate nucleotidase CysQ n=1 Tax=Phenylobacterium sp. TaxID=1871053 RepID=UPI00398346EC